MGAEPVDRQDDRTAAAESAPAAGTQASTPDAGAAVRRTPRARARPDLVDLSSGDAGTAPLAASASAVILFGDSRDRVGKLLRPLCLPQANPQDPDYITAPGEPIAAYPQTPSTSSSRS